LNGAPYVGLILNMSCLPANENYYYSYYGLYPQGRVAGEA
jgi:hypothetical protein